MLFRLSDIQKSYGSAAVLSGASFQINPFERVGLVGRNGTGKTTLFRIITGEESADSGEVAKAKGLRIGMLDQHVDFSVDESVHTAALSAFQKLHDIEAEMRKLEVGMETDSSSEILERYAELQTNFERQGGFEFTAKAESMLLGMGFPKDDWSLKTSELSGGQKNRLGMARLLLSESNILLLDEPTNHLDVAAVEWVEEYLKSYDQAYIVISHDRYFLDRTCTKIVEIDNGKAFVYKGNYSKFLIESEIRQEQKQREFENQRAFINKTEAFIRKNLAGQKTKQAKSRRTLLARMDRLETVVEKRSGKFEIDNVQRTGANVLHIEDLSIGYEEKTLAGGIDLLLHRGDCLGIIGGNGSGKTTFLKTVLSELEALGGKFVWGTKTEIGYYSQELEGLDKRNDLIAELRKIEPHAENGALRSFLAGFLFVGEDVFKKVGDLSGGEKGRLSIAKLIFSKANVLVLDEPTNHLDIASREALEEALRNFGGTIVTVSHDRYFLDQLATQILVFRGNGKVDVFNGNYSEYHDWRDRNLVETEVENILVPSDKRAGGRSLSKNEARKNADRILKVEGEILACEEELKDIENQLANSDGESEQDRYRELSKGYREKQEKLKSLYLNWEELAKDQTQETR